MLAFGVQKSSFKPKFALKFSQRRYIFFQIYNRYVKFDKKVKGVIGCGLCKDKHSISTEILVSFSPVAGKITSITEFRSVLS